VPDQLLGESRRRWLRISVRGLITLVLVIGSWLGWIAHGARVQREAVAAIRRAAGGVTYDWRYPDGDFDPNGAPGWPEWLVARLGQDCFGYVSRVDLFGRMTPDDHLSARDRSRITAALAQIGHFSRLVELNLTGTEADDGALAGLRSLTRLRRLDLNGTRITDAALLEGMKRLEELDLYGTPISDKGLVSLKGLTHLRRLDLGRTGISDAGLLHLASLRSLEELNISETRVADAGLAQLRQLPSLKELGLYETRVSDAGLTYLRALTSLQGLNVSNTNVTAAGVHQLQLTLPKLLIQR
jgi:hypothetical protein